MSLQFDAAPEEIKVWIEEAEEQIQLLDCDIIILEKDGPNPELLQEVFRAAHTLKGSSAAIGHNRMANLTHAMESLLDCVRKDKLDVSTALIDLLLRSLDALRILKEEVITLEHSGLDPSELVAQLKQFLEDNRPLDEPEPAPAVASDPGPDSLAIEQGERAYRVAVYVDRESMFPAARLLQVHMALAEIGTISESVPSKEEIEAEKVGTEAKLVCVTDEDGHALRDLIMAIPEIVAIRVENAANESDVVVEQDAFAFHSLSQNASGTATPASEPSVSVNPSVDSAGNDLNQASGPRSQPVEERRSGEDRRVGEDRRSGEDRRAGAKGIAASKTVRIDVERLDALMNLVGELVTDCTRLVQLSARLTARYEGEEIAQGIGETSQHIQRITDDLHDRIMKARMFPVASVFSRFPRMVRDLAQKAGKQIEFEMDGEETELDRSVIEEIGDPIIHLLRNAVDHGVEAPEKRAAVGKSERGHIRLAACHRESRILLTVEDDGKGIDPEKIKQSAVEKGLISAEAAARMSDREAQEIIFASGFSTAGQITDVSGRGVGMDIVRTNIHKLNGQVSVESYPGRGTRFTLELPLTLAIMDALLVGMDGKFFAIPLASVTETLRVGLPEISSVNGEKVIQHRGRVLPLLPLDTALGLSRNGDGLDNAYVVVVGTAEGEQVGIAVDSLVGEQQVVIKSLGNFIGDVRGLSGATILGDGRVALILDVPALVRKIIQERAGDVIYV